jgi:superfamily II RNA helicase
MPEFHQRVSVLQQLGYVSPDGTVTLKGRAACEINSTQVRERWCVLLCCAAAVLRQLDLKEFCDDQTAQA